MTPEEAMFFLDNISDYVEDNTNDIMFEGSKEMEELMKYRIFKMGKNSFNSQIGDYMSGKWIQLRIDRGRQVDYVDLNFTGELRQSIYSFGTKDGAVIQFADSFNLEKANKQELLQGQKAGANRMEIFTSTKEEVKTVADDTEKKYLSGFDDIINSYQ